MLKIKNFVFNNDILSMIVLVEGDENRAYNLSVDINTEYLSVVESDIPQEYKIYERQAKTALRKYRGKELPDTITSAWC